MYPPERDPLLPLNPSFMKTLYAQWQHTHGIQATEKLEETCNDPTHPDEGKPALPPAELPETARERLHEALAVAEWLKTDTQSLDPSQVETMLQEAHSLADLEYKVYKHAEKEGHGYRLLCYLVIIMDF